MATIIVPGLIALLAVGGEPGRPHAVEAAHHQGAAAVLDRPTGDTKQAASNRVFNRIVYGYFPYWISSTDLIPWQHLTHLSYFSVEVRSNGSLGDAHGWSTGGRSLVEMGRAHGVKVTLTATLFDDAAIAALLADTTARNALVQNLVSIVQAQGGEGINIDFEMVPRSVKDPFVTFMAALTSAFHLAIPGSHVSLASPAVDWNGSYDFDQLALACDGLMIMGYGYHWSGGDPGPNAPIYSGTTWSGHDLVWTVEDYLTWGGVENRGKFVLGLPLYGIDWPASSAAVPGTATGSGSSRTLSACDERLVGGAWDQDSATPFHVYQESGWRQLFCEDASSLALKLDLVEQYDLGGVMFWAIGYAPVAHGLWAAVDERFVEAAAGNRAPVAVARAPNDAEVGVAIVLDGSESVDPDGDLLDFAWSQQGGPPLAIEQADQARARVVPTVSGQYRFVLAVSDGLASAQTEAVIVVFETVTVKKKRPATVTGGCNGAGGCSPAWGFVALLVLARRRLA